MVPTGPTTGTPTIGPTMGPTIGPTDNCVDDDTWFFEDNKGKQKFCDKMKANKCDQFIGVDGRSATQACPVKCQICTPP